MERVFIDSGEEVFQNFTLPVNERENAFVLRDSSTFHGKKCFVIVERV